MTELERWFQSRNCRTVKTQQLNGPVRKQPLAIFTCVEAVKRILGIRATWVLTPWQLYRRLSQGTAHRDTSVKEGIFRNNSKNFFTSGENSDTP